MLLPFLQFLILITLLVLTFNTSSLSSVSIQFFGLMISNQFRLSCAYKYFWVFFLCATLKCSVSTSLRLFFLLALWFSFPVLFLLSVCALFAQTIFLYHLTVGKTCTLRYYRLYIKMNIVIVTSVFTDVLFFCYTQLCI